VQLSTEPPRSACGDVLHSLYLRSTALQSLTALQSRTRAARPIRCTPLFRTQPGADAADLPSDTVSPPNPRTNPPLTDTAQMTARSAGHFGLQKNPMMKAQSRIAQRPVISLSLCSLINPPTIKRSLRDKRSYGMALAAPAFARKRPVRRGCRRFPVSSQAKPSTGSFDGEQAAREVSHSAESLMPPVTERRHEIYPRLQIDGLHIKQCENALVAYPHGWVSICGGFHLFGRVATEVRTVYHPAAALSGARMS
jgi:hypothetical protein